MKERKVIMFNLPKEIVDKLDRLAKSENRNRSNMIETLILKELQNKKERFNEKTT